MFLKKLFNFGKDCSHYLEKGDRYLADGRYADARNAYRAALEKLEASGEMSISLRDTVQWKIAQAGNMLGRMNMAEAEYALAAGNGHKAGEHLRLVLDLAEDALLREKAGKLLSGLETEAFDEPAAGDVGDYDIPEEVDTEVEFDEQDVMDDSISSEDRLSLYYHTLPGDLPERYAAMGDEFARGCLLNLEGNENEALEVFEKLAAGTESDILDYERAILHYHHGDSGTCEQLLLRSISLNSGNPLSHVGLVQLYGETGREREALQVLERMIADDLVSEQARMMQGDLYTMLQDDANAIESYSQLLSSARFARDAVMRIVPLLEKQGRTAEAVYLVKKFAAGCC